MLPTSEEKREIIRQYGQKYGLRTFIETGSADGNNIIALNDDFDFLITVELDVDNYHQVARNTLYLPKIRPWWGDSEIVLPYLMQIVQGPALIFLDAHWNGKVVGMAGHTPVRTELEHALHGNANHVILIDDVHQFGSDPDYPLLEWVESFVKERRPGHRFSVADDIIRITP